MFTLQSVQDFPHITKKTPCFLFNVIGDSPEVNPESWTQLKGSLHPLSH